MASINELKANHYQSGTIEWIGLRAQRQRTIQRVERAELVLDHGLVGDKAGQRAGGKRQVTLIQAEYFPVLQSFLGKDRITPDALRRNIVVSGINLSILLRHSLKINDAILEITGNCAPCSKMEKELGFGGFNAMRNHGGVNAMVTQGGMIQIGDCVEVIQQNTEAYSHQEKLL